MSRSDSDKERCTRGISRKEGFLRSGLVCGLLLLSFLAVQGHSQDTSQELAFARKLFDDGLYILAAEQYHDFALANPSSPMAVQARFMVGESYFANGDLAEAQEVYREFLARDPMSYFASQAWVRLGTCLSKVGHFSDAAAAFSRSGRMDPDGPWAAPALFGMADALRRAGEAARALEKFDAFVNSYPQNSQVHEAHMARGEILVDLDQLNQARLAYQVAAQQATSPLSLTEARFREGRVMVLQGDVEGAVDLFSLLIGEGPGSVYVDSALCLLGDLHLDRGEYREAAEVFGVLAWREEANEFAEWAGFQQAESLRLAADHEGAISAYRRWLARYPRSTRVPEAKLGLSGSLQVGGDLDSAAVVLEGLTREAGAAEWGPQAWKELGNILLQMGKPGRALSNYREFLGRYPQAPQADSLYFCTAQILEMDMNRPQAALRVYQTLSSLYPQSRFADDADFAMGRCNEASAEYDRALQAYRVFVQEHPLSPLYPQAQKETAYLSKYRVAQEDSALEAMVDIHDQLSSGSLGAEEVDLRLGEIYFRHLKNFSRAAAALERFVQKNPESPMADGALFQMAECYQTRAEMLEIEGDVQGAAREQSTAAEICRRLLKAYPHSVWVDRCALQVIADVLRNGDSRSDDYWLDQLDLYDSFLRTYTESKMRGYAHLRRGKAYLKLSDRDTLSVNKADSIFALISDRHSHSPWADTAAFERIEIAQQREDEMAALMMCDDFLGEFSESGLQSRVLFIKGRIYAHRREYHQAAELFHWVAEDFPYHPLSEEARLRWAESLQAAGDTQGARRVLEEFEELYSESPLRIRAVVLLAKDMAEGGRDHEAQKLLSSMEEVISREALDDELRLVLGDLYVELGFLQKALDNYEALVEEYPSSSLVILALERVAEVNFNRQSFSEAQAYYQRAMNETSDEQKRLHLESRVIICMYRLGHLQEAVEARKKFEKTHSEQSDLMAELLIAEGQAYLSQEQRDNAQKAFKTVLKHYKESYHVEEAEYRLGLLALTAGDFSEALQRFQTLVEDHPQSQWVDKAVFKMASSFFGLERYDQAAEYYEQVARRTTETDMVIDALFNSGICRGKMNDWDGASVAYEILLRDFSQNPERQKWVLRLGFAYLQADQPARALRTFEQIDAGKDAEFGAEIQFWLGECYFHLREYEKAAQEYLRVAYLYPYQDQWAATAEYNAGVSYEKLGREEEARTIYGKLVATRGPGDQWGDLARERLDELGD